MLIAAVVVVAVFPVNDDVFVNVVAVSDNDVSLDIFVTTEVFAFSNLSFGFVFVSPDFNPSG